MLEASHYVCVVKSDLKLAHPNWEWHKTVERAMQMYRAKIEINSERYFITVKTEDGTIPSASTIKPFNGTIKPPTTNKADMKKISNEGLQSCHLECVPDRILKEILANLKRPQTGKKNALIQKILSCKLRKTELQLITKHMFKSKCAALSRSETIAKIKTWKPASLSSSKSLKTTKGTKRPPHPFDTVKIGSGDFTDLFAITKQPKKKKLAPEKPKPKGLSLSKESLWHLAQLCAKGTVENLKKFQKEHGFEVKPASAVKGERIEQMKAAVKLSNTSLKELCREKGIKKISTLSKEGLINLIFDSAVRLADDQKSNLKPKPNSQKKPKHLKSTFKFESKSKLKGKGFKSRVFDVMDESHISGAIHGIQKTKIVQLIDAVRFCCTPKTDLIFKHLKSNVLASTDFANNFKIDNPKEKLSKNEIAAIHFYTQETPFYKVLNEKLRHKDRKAANPFFHYLHILTNALKKLPSIKATVHRGVNLDLSKHYQRGKTITWWAFSSTSSNPQVTKAFLGKKEKTYYNIQTLRAKNIQRFSSEQSEDELLLGMATSFKVDGVVEMGEDSFNVFLIEQNEGQRWS